MHYIPDLLQKKPFVFPEAPRWFRDAFYFCDIDAGTLYRIGADGTAQAIYVHGSPVSGWVRLNDGSLLVVAGLERRIVSVRDGVATTFADATGLVGWALNDLLRAPDGHCYVGAVDFNLFADPGKVGQPSPLVHVAPDGRASIATREISFPNGMTILPSGELLVADSLTGELLAFTRQADGALTDRRVWAAIPGEMPDGISLDAEGAVWIASHHRVLRVLEGGGITDVVDMGATRATACMLGGADGRTLLITASDTHDRAEIRAKGPSGALFTVQVAVAGAGLPSIYVAAP
jgi:sugar lactone lactonase YvrE